MEFNPYEEFEVPVTPEELTALEAIGHSIRRSAGQPFFLEGEQGDFALLIRKGHVKVVSGTPPRVVDVRGPGSIVGELGVISGGDRMASIFAWDEVEALYLPGGDWLQFLHDHPRACLALVKAGGDMIIRATQKNAESELAIEQQLAKRLIDLLNRGLGEATADEAVVFRRLGQQDLASLIGAKKLDSVKKVIRLLKAAGIVDTGRQVITILQPAVLREIADGNRTVS
ncbi:MAG: Crp/Fnr family transcriptional regulator [Actinobacteria bacterium]|nr:Crp/Fnr family transcriptional regulator [Actinomycetota bacterium]